MEENSQYDTLHYPILLFLLHVFHFLTSLLGRLEMYELPGRI
jgi:hypothetical protein